MMIDCLEDNMKDYQNYFVPYHKIVPNHTLMICELMSSSYRLV